ncbi:MAG: hypothetical protein LBK44_06165, partial [Spirochaetales bacterium]|nr:hypothetical protein [Spirochaetales bacterium]
MRFLWAFRCNPLHEQKNCIRNFSTSPLRSGSSRQGPAIAGARELPWEIRRANPAAAPPRKGGP